MSAITKSYLAALFVFLLPVLSARPATAQESPPNSVVERVQARFAELEKEQQRLQNEGDSASAAELAKELSRAKAMLEGTQPSEHSDKPELHAVGIGAGGAAPPGVLIGNDRFTRGFAEISVTHAAAPLVLYVGAAERIHFRFSLSPDVRIFAIVFGGRFTPTYDGLPEGTLVLNQAADAPDGAGYIASTWGDANFQAVAQALREFSGLDLQTVTHVPRYLGQPLVVGPENTVWRAQLAMAMTDASHERALNAARRQEVEKLVNVRFAGLFFQDGTAAEAMFTIQGPLIESMKPIAHDIRHLFHDAKSGLDFAIDHQTELVVVQRDQEEHTRVTLDAALPSSLRLNTLAYDTKRERFVLTGRDDNHGVYAYHLKDATWKLLQETGPVLSSLVYVPEKDEFVGISVTNDMGERGEGATIYRLDVEGHIVEGFRPNIDILHTWGDFGGTMLSVQNNKLIVVTPPERLPEGNFRSHVHVVDMASREVLYEGPATPHDGKSEPRLAPAMKSSGRGLLHRLIDRFALVDAAGQSLREKGQSDQANELASRAEQLRKRLRGEQEAQPGDKPRLHIIGGYATGNTTVEVTSQAEPIVLVLCSYNPSSWSVRVADGARLERLIVAGYHRQTVKESPAGVALETYSHDEQTGGFYISSRDDDSYPDAIKKIESLTGLRPSTFQAVGQSTARRIVLGPENGSWLAADVADQLDELAKNALAERQAARGKPLEKYRFLATYRTVSAGRQPHEPSIPQLAEFSVRGPLPQTLLELPERAEQVALDPTTGDRYTRHHDELMRHDAKTGADARIEWDAALPELSWPSAIAFDARRQRLLLSSFGGGGFLYAYDVPRNSWSVVCRPGLSTSAMIYAEEEDAIYAVNLAMDQNGVSLVKRFNANGALVETIPLPIKIQSPGGPLLHPEFDLAYFDGHLAILGPLVVDPLNKDAMLPQIHVVELASRTMVYEGLLRPHPGVKDLSAKEMDDLWATLSDREIAKSEHAQWELAAGHAESVAYIANHLTEFTPPNETVVRQLIADLDSDAFETRRTAQEELSKYGRAIVPILQQEQAHPSAEVRSSIQRLLRAVEQGLPSDPQLAREVRATRVLEIMNTPEAISLLQEIAAGSDALDRTAAAKSALERLNRQVPATR